MAKRNKIPELEEAHGDLHNIIPKLVNTGGQAYAAFQLGTTQSTVSRWLKDNNYRQVITYVKQEEKSA